MSPQLQPPKSKKQSVRVLQTRIQTHGEKANGRRIVMYSGEGREDPERGEIYDEQF